MLLFLMALALTLVLAPEQYQASYRFRIFECGTVCPPYAPFTSEAFEYFVPEAIVQPTVNPSHWTTNGCKFVNGIPPELSRFAEAECRVISMPKAVPAGIDYEIELCFLMKSLTFNIWVDTCCEKRYCMRVVVGFAPRTNRHIDEIRTYSRIKCKREGGICATIPEEGLRLPYMLLKKLDNPACTVREAYRWEQ